MTQIRLSGADSELLGEIELDAELPFTALAKVLQRKPSALQRSFARLVELGVVNGKTAIIDASVLGLVEFGFYLELGSRTKSEREAFVRAMLGMKGISWIAEVGGEFDLACNILARHPIFVQRIFEELSLKFPNLVRRKRMVQRTTRIRYRRGYLAGRSGARFRMGEGSGGVELSEDESKVISVLDRLKFQSLRDLAKESQMSSATFSRVVRRLRARKVIAGFGFRFNTELLGMQQFRVLLSFRHISPALVKDLEEFVVRIKGVKLLVRCLGEWDYELEVDVSGSRRARDISDILWERYAAELNRVTFVPLFEHRKYISFGTFA